MSTKYVTKESSFFDENPICSKKLIKEKLTYSIGRNKGAAMSSDVIIAALVTLTVHDVGNLDICLI
jgi:hypothetical protein